MISEKEYINRNIFFILKSEIRLNILSELNEKSQSIADIVNKTNMAYSSVSSNMHRLVFITSTYYYFCTLAYILCSPQVNIIFCGGLFKKKKNKTRKISGMSIPFIFSLIIVLSPMLPILNHIKQYPVPSHHEQKNHAKNLNDG